LRNNSNNRAMCFSAGASFAGGAVISAIGFATVKEVRYPSQKLFASIPLFFAFQQFAEGLLWLTLQSGGHETIKTLATYSFLLMALVIWPLMIPVSLFRLEDNPKRKKMIGWFVMAGIILALYYTVCLLKYHVYPNINGFHIRYINDFPVTLRNIAFGIYVFATITPLFISTARRMYLFGILIILSCFITGIFYKEYLTSVWCFFAALISIVVYFIVKEPESANNLIKDTYEGKNRWLSYFYR
jgi:hypothetical protein